MYETLHHNQAKAQAKLLELFWEELFGKDIYTASYCARQQKAKHSPSASGTNTTTTANTNQTINLYYRGNHYQLFFFTKASRNFFALTFHVIVACFFVFRNELTRPPTTEKRTKWALTQGRHVQLSIEEVKRENKNLTRSRRLLLSTPVFSVLLFVTCHFKKFLYQVAFWWMWKETYLFHFCVPRFYSNQTPPPA